VRRAALAGLFALLTLPAVATAADTPTGGLDASTTTAAPAPAAPADPAAGPVPSRASAELAGAGTWIAVPSAGAGSPLNVIGRFSTSLADRRVRVERRTASGRWQQATTARVRSTGRFVAVWRTRSTRVHELRVVLVPLKAAESSEAASSRATADPQSVTIAVLGRAKATWYGPGFYGRRTACGVTLQPDTVGIAHRTLPCGTQVEIRRGGKSVVVPVIDRGPFANDATFDLTKSVADRVGVTGVDPVSFVQRDDLPRAPVPATATR